MTIKPLANDRSKLIQVLQKLSSSQLTKLRKLIESPYFHQTDGVKVLFNHLRKFHPKYPTTKIADEIIAQQLFPETKNGAKKIRNFKADLMKLLEQFLIQQQFSKQENQQKMLLVQAYQDLELPDYADSNIKKIEQTLEQSNARGLPYHHQKVQLLHFQYYHPDTPKVFKNQEKLQTLLDQLDHYFVLAKYKYVHEATQRMSTQNEDFELRFWKEVQTETSNLGGSQKQSPLYYYQELQRLITQGYIDEKSFKSLKIDFFKNLKHLYQEDQQAIFSYLGNYISKALNSGALHFTKLQLDLFKDGLSNNLLISGNRISPTSFLNIVVVAAKYKEFDWTENFISSYKNYLNPEYHEDVSRIAKAFICFHQQDANQALSILGSAIFKDHSLELFCLPLVVKSMFEIYLQNQSYQTTILSQLNGFAKRCSTKYEFSVKSKQEYLNYVRFVQNLVKAYTSTKINPATIKNIRKGILSTDHLIHRSWLLEKCDQMLSLGVL